MAIAVLSVCIFSCKSKDSSSSQVVRVACQNFSITCQHGGACGERDLGNNQYKDTCTCPSSYEGTYCQTPARNKFLGTYIGVMSQQDAGSATVQTFADTVTIVANADETMASVEHLYQFLIPSVQPAAYITLVLQANQSSLTSASAKFKSLLLTRPILNSISFTPTVRVPGAWPAAGLMEQDSSNYLHGLKPPIINTLPKSRHWNMLWVCR